MRFVGRAMQLRHLADYSAPVFDGRSSGRALLVTGRRRVGKSRLIQEFCDRSGLPYVVFQATRGRPPSAERAEFVAAVARSPLPGAHLVDGMGAADWVPALRAVAVAMATGGPAIVVIDELPWLMEQDAAMEGALQTVWDRDLSSMPVVLILIGSDTAVMNALQAPSRAFHRRATPMTVQPLSVADVQDMTRASADTAVDAALVTGGFPELVAEWHEGMSWESYVAEAVTTPLSPLLVAGQLSLLGEFPDTSVSRSVLRAIGSGERSFSSIATTARGGTPLAAGTLSPLLHQLAERGIVAVDRPLSTRLDTRNSRYRIADSYLRFWLAFLADGIPLVERGRGDVLRSRIEGSWSTWRGRAVEPLVREAVARLAAQAGWPDVSEVGGWWNRANNPEIDLIGADRSAPAKAIQFVGSIKWLDRAPFDARDRYDLERDAAVVPGVTSTTPRVAVSRTGVDGELDLDAVWSADDVVQAFR